MSLNNYFIYNAYIVNEKKIFRGDVLIQHGKINKIIKEGAAIDEICMANDTQFIDASDMYLLPGVIDEHVHFREPGLTHKGSFLSESKAAVAGGVTSVMDMPNVIPQTTTLTHWKEKMQLAEKKMYTNYAFYLAATDTNWEEIKHLDTKRVCGIKLFIGSSTGNMLISDSHVLEKILQFQKVPLVAHCEDESIIRANTESMKAVYGEDIPIGKHPLIRSEEACYLSSRNLIELAKKYNASLHILHISTAKELALFTKEFPSISGEICVAYLFFDDSHYQTLGTKMKCNPAIKTIDDKRELIKALSDTRIASIASDHAPHSAEEKNNTYLKAPSGIPMVQHTLPLMLELYWRKEIRLQTIVEKMCHAPARLFQIEKRGFIKENFYADLVLVNVNRSVKINSESIYYHCGWSPFENTELHTSIEKTFVNGVLAFDNGVFSNEPNGKPLFFNR
ncbi:MAG: dihydroorotase [Bacteroidales bacterium]|nr:dihydroorotase [Bacteroidales bacterium]MDD4208830.1 dihydroorotase [Bacteroidales bacterium]